MWTNVKTVAKLALAVTAGIVSMKLLASVGSALVTAVGNAAGPTKR